MTRIRSIARRPGADSELHIEYAPRAVEDLRGLSEADRCTIREAPKRQVSADHGFDVAPLVGSASWRRLRIGEWRLIYRPLTEVEAIAVGGSGVLVARVVHRSVLLDAVDAVAI